MDGQNNVFERFFEKKTDFDLFWSEIRSKYVLNMQIPISRGQQI